MELILFFSIVIFVVFIKYLFSSSEEDKFHDFHVFIVCIYSLIIIVLSAICLRKPQAIDVYEGKTTLEITYKDKVPIDSTVVWKNK